MKHVLPKDGHPHNCKGLGQDCECEPEIDWENSKVIHNDLQETERLLAEAELLLRKPSSWFK